MAQWLCRRFERLFRQLSPPSDLGRFALPAEIILMIMSHLDGLSTTFLAFTCRDLYRFCTPGQLVLTAAERTQLLQYLEDNIADAYFCRYCGTLHRWHGYWSHSISRWISEHTPRQHGRDDIYFSPFILIPFSHALGHETTLSRLQTRSTSNLPRQANTYAISQKRCQAVLNSSRTHRP